MISLIKTISVLSKRERERERDKERERYREREGEGVFQCRSLSHAALCDLDSIWWQQTPLNIISNISKKFASYLLKPV